MSTISAGTTSTTALVQTGDTTGSLILQTGSTPTTAMTISSSQIVNFANAPTVAGAALPSGDMTLISTLTGNSSSTMQWTGLSGYNSYFIIFKNIQPQSAGAGTQFGMVVGIGSTTYLSSGYAQSGMLTYGNNIYYGRNSTLSYFQLCGAYNGINTGGTGANGSITMGGFISNYFSHQTNSFVYTYTGGVLESDNLSGAITSSNTITAIKLQFADGSVPASGTASLYGISS